MRYGERLKAARTLRNLSQAQLYEAIDRVCSQENISKLERGEATGSEYTVHFARALGIRPEWLAMEDGAMELDPRAKSLVELFIGSDKRGKDNIYRVAEQESRYNDDGSEKERGTG